MLTEPASKVSVPLMVVNCTLSNVPEIVCVPPNITVAFAAYIEKTPLAIQIFPDTLFNSIDPDKALEATSLYIT